MSTDVTLHEKICDTSYASLFRGALASGAPVVVKVLSGEYPSATDLARLEHEHQTLSGLALPEVARTLGLVSVGSRSALLLEPMTGRSLAELLAHGRPAVERALAIAAALARAVASIHGAGVLHKDLKPAHFFVDEQTLEVKLIDFGLATRLSGAVDARRIARGEGTLAYMAPEQTGLMNREIDQRSDLYSLGVTLYELFTGVRPFASDDPLEVVHAHVARVPASPRELVAEVPEMVSAIVMRLLAKAAEDRYQDAGGLVADLEHCLAALRATGQVEPFALGRCEALGTLRPPQRLYGRERELASLTAAFERTCDGAAELVLIAGPSGIGKSAVVRELHRRLVRKGRLIAGKFDQLNRSIPYEPIAQACRALVTAILSEPQGVLAGWAARIRQALGPNGEVIAKIVPELELVIGKSSAVVALGPSESQNRFERTFQSFIQVFTSADHPLVLFLDDLQWADPASLRLLKVLLTSPERGHLLVLGAYRDQEVGAAHPLELAIQDLQKTGVVRAIAIGPLAEDDVASFIADTLGEPAQDVAPLAALALRKTAGNPFFLGQFLRAIADQGLSVFHREQRRWRWDVARVERAMVTDNVIDLLVAQLHRLGPRTQEVLRLAACIGNRFSLTTLARVSNRSVEEVVQDLWEALRDELVLPVDDRQRYRYATEGAGDAASAASYRFQHDRVQQAAYSLIAPGDRSGVHLQLGRLLRDASGGAIPDEALFEVVGHLNRGAALVTERAERIDVARLDLRAGLRARDSAAYDAAADLLAQSLALLGDEPFAADYACAYAALAGLAECEAARGDTARAFAHLDVLDGNAAEGLDRAAARRLKASVLTQENRMAEAIVCAVEACRMLGTELPLEPGALEAAGHAEFAALQQALAGRDGGVKIDSLAHLPVMTDPRALATAETLAALVPAANQTNPGLAALIAFKAVSLALAAGNPPAAPHYYTMYALLVGAITGDRATSHRLGKLGVELGARPFHRRYAGAAEFVFAALVAPFCTRYPDSILHFRHSVQASLETGDQIHLGYSIAVGCLWRLFVDDDMTALAGDCERLRNALRQNSDRTNWYSLGAVRRALATLQGTPLARITMTGEPYDDAQEDAALRANPCTYAFDRGAQLLAHYLIGDLDGALAISDEYERFLIYQRGWFVAVEHAFYRALVRAGLARREPERRAELCAALARDEAELVALAGGSPLNYACRIALVAAERAALAGEVERAIIEYDRALALARDGGFVLHEALAAELCARFHLSSGRGKVGRVYLMDAYLGYQRWGAAVKVKELGAEFAELLLPTQAAPAVARRSLESGASYTGQLDLESAVRVTEAIASELQLGRLIERLMRSLVEHAGAQRGFLVFARDERLVVSAAITVDPEQVRLGLSQDLEASAELATSVVQLATRSLRAVVVGDAATDHRFAGDAYVVRSRPKSILCVAMVHRGRLRGALYLENNAATAAFDPARAQLLEFLAAQAATAIENAALYEELEDRVARRTADLAEANQRLGKSLKELGDAQRTLIDLSRRAGMAEVATSILHNVGNALNSVGVSSDTVAAAIRRSKTAGLGKIAELIAAHRGDLGQFFTQDERGRRVPDYLGQLARVADDERGANLRELELLHKNLEHIKAIVAMQQSHARRGGVVEDVALLELLDEAIKLSGQASNDPSVTVASDYADAPHLAVDRHKVMQILFNLLANAYQAVADAAVRVITLRCRAADGRVQISVIDHGVGISVEHQRQLFQHGFTTKKTGHGFGLHASANLATEIGGTLRGHSDGPGQGATFTLELPLRGDTGPAAS